MCGLERLNRSRFGSLILPLISSDALGKTLLCLDLSFHIYKMEVIKPTLRGHCEKYQQSMKNGMFALGCRRTLITGSYPDCPSQSTPGQQQMVVQGVKSWHIAILPQHILQVWSQCIERTFIKWSSEGWMAGVFGERSSCIGEFLFLSHLHCSAEGEETRPGGCLLTPALPHFPLVSSPPVHVETSSPCQE